MSIRNADTLLGRLVSAGFLEKKGEDYRYTRMFAEEFADILTKRLEDIKDRLDLLSLRGREILISKVLVLMLLKHFKVMDRDVAVAGVMAFVEIVGNDTLNAICDKLIKVYDEGK